MYVVIQNDAPHVAPANQIQTAKSDKDSLLQHSWHHEEVRQNDDNKEEEEEE